MVIKPPNGQEKERTNATREGCQQTEIKVENQTTWVYEWNSLKPSNGVRQKKHHSRDKTADKKGRGILFRSGHVRDPCGKTTKG